MEQLLEMILNTIKQHTNFLNKIWLILFFLPWNISGQTIFYPPFQNIADMEILDSCRIKITYSYKQTVDIKNSITKNDIQILEIGNNISKYYSYLAFYSDSSCTEWHSKHKNAQSSPRYIGINAAQNPLWTEIYRSKQGYMIYERSPGNYRYAECLNLQNWKLYDDTLTVTGYLCQKAECSFRGRDYTAWFTVDIPVDNGPWKFGGLPGLILRIYDAKSHYIFDCTEIDRMSAGCYIKRYKTNFQLTSREKILKTEKARHDDFTKELRLNGGNFWVAGRGDMTNTIVRYPYNPIELK
jgi:GLPGLI family protein